MKPENRLRRLSPAFIAFGTVVILIAGTMFIGWLNARRYRVNARVEIAAPVAANNAQVSPASPIAANLPDGEVARLAARIREATGLLMGLTVLSVTEQMSNRTPATADALLGLMSQRNLYPPGISHSATNGALVSARATLYLRYRLQPLGIEVVSIGRERSDGPAVIARLDATGDDHSGAALLIAKSSAGVVLPEPFKPLPEVAALGWSVEALRERPVAIEEIDELNK
jgi:hypothetical protein